MIRWYRIYSHVWFYHEGDHVQPYQPFGPVDVRRGARAHINATFPLGRLLEAIR